MAVAPDTGTGWGDAERLRFLLLLIVLAGAIGLALELILLEHTESVWQWIPLVLLGASVFAGLAVWRGAGNGSLRVFRAVMALCIAAGVLGLYLHFSGNIEFERENDPSVTGLALVWNALRGATPALAPGAMAQLGLLGLLYTFRHPALRREATRPSRETR